MKLSVLDLRVHSLFNTACNLIDQKGNIITLLIQPRFMMPGALLLSQKVWQNWKVDQQLTISSQRLVAKDIEVDLSQVELFLPFMPRYHFDKNSCYEGWSGNKKLILNELFSLLAVHIKPQGIFSHLLPLFKIVQNALLINKSLLISKSLDKKTDKTKEPAPLGYIDFINFLMILERSEYYNNPILIIDTVKKIIGFGAGLTPSADDFILGYLSIQQFQHTKNVISLHKAILANLSHTTFASQIMLKNACSNMYSQNILEIISNIYQVLNIYKNSDIELKKSMNILSLAFQHALNYGHSSGHDMLCGLYFGLALMELK